MQSDLEVTVKWSPPKRYIPYEVCIGERIYHRSEIVDYNDWKYIDSLCKNIKREWGHTHWKRRYNKYIFGESWIKIDMSNKELIDFYHTS